MVPVNWQSFFSLRCQKIISKETTIGIVIVTGSAKPILCIRIRHANFPVTRDMQCVNAGYMHGGAVLFQINYARHIPSLKIPWRWRHYFPPKYWSHVSWLNLPWSLRQYDSRKHWEKPTELKVAPKDGVVAWRCWSFLKGCGTRSALGVNLM